MVPNPSFEDTIACPTGAGQVWKAEHWYVAEKTPDYFNECCTNPAFAVPNSTLWGHRYPATGFAFCGFMCYSTIDTFYREKIGTQLTSALSVGEKYFVSFKLTTTTRYNTSGASNKIGALFSTTQHTSNNPSPTKNYCQMWVDSIITDTTNWVNVWGTFIADSAYTYLTLGNFFTNAHTDTLRFWEPPPQTSYFLQSYYFIDDICVSQDSGECIASPVALNVLHERKRELKVYPNPANEYIIIETEIDESSVVELYSTQGILILARSIPRGWYQFRIDVGELKNDVYFLKVNGNNRNFTNKIVIHH